MGSGELGWIVFLAGLPFAPFLNRSLDIWHGQALWAQMWVMLLWAWGSHRQLATRRLPLPLALWVAWITLRTGWIYVLSITQAKQYPLSLLGSVVHLLLAICFIQAALWTWDRDWLERLLTAVAWSGVLVMAYSVLQLLNLDPFFKSIDNLHPRDPFVGTIGNPSHYGAYLSLLLPILLFQRGRMWRAMAVCCAGGILLSGSASATIALVAILIWWAWQRQHHYLTQIVGTVGLLGLAAGCVWHRHYFSFDGRLQAWHAFWPYLQANPLVGLGPGFIINNSLRITEGPLFQWRHIHNEWYQFAIEQGLVGVGLIGWAVVSLLRRAWPHRRDPLVLTCLTVFLAGCLNSGVNFTAHLWMLGSLVLLAYSGLLVLTDGAENLRRM